MDDLATPHLWVVYRMNLPPRSAHLAQDTLRRIANARFVERCCESNRAASGERSVEEGARLFRTTAGCGRANLRQAIQCADCNGDGEQHQQRGEPWRCEDAEEAEALKEAGERAERWLIDGADLPYLQRVVRRAEERVVGELLQCHPHTRRQGDRGDLDHGELHVRQEGTGNGEWSSDHPLMVAFARSEMWPR